VRGIRERLMGTEVLVVLPPREAAAVLGWLRDVERVFSRFRPDSDTARAAAGAGRPVRVSELFLRVLAEACRHQAATGGLFSPFLGADLARLGYARDFAAGPLHEDPGPAPAGSVRLDPGASTVELPPGLRVDLGGFVKGWSVQAAAGAARSPRGLVDAGGDLAAWRDPADRPWRVGVEHPLTPGRPAGVLTLPPRAAVATSSVVRRAWTAADGTRRHHIVDPRTGEPATSDCLQATVLTDDLGRAEVLATCLTILGTADGPGWLARTAPDADWLTVDRDGRVRHSPGLPLEVAAG
jgi:thiamine biosynthesis lipoprotein